MKIKRIRAYQVELPLHEGSYKWSGGKSVSVFDSTVVEVETDAGVTGWGEVCPLGPFYLPAYANGVRAGIAELGPHLLGEDPLSTREIEPPDGCRPQGTRLRQVRHRHGLLGHSRQGHGPTGVHSSGRPLRRRFRSVSRHLAGIARGDGEARRGLSRRRLHADFSSRSAATRIPTSNAFAPFARCSNRATASSPTPIPVG